MDDEATEMDDIGRALAKAIDQAWLETRESNFPEMVNAYRDVEAEFVRRAGKHEFFVLETKRRIAEAILRQAHSTEQSVQVCQDAWNELLGLGFTNLERQCTMAWFYADCCLLNEKFDVGLGVLEPLIIEMAQSFNGPTLAPEERGWYEKELVTLCQIRDELKAGIRK